MWLTGIDPAEEVPVPLEVLARRLGRPPHEIVRLDTDENPYGPSLRVLEVLGSADTLQRPPDPEARDLRAALEAYTHVHRERIAVGAGLADLCARVLRVATAPGQTILTCPPTRGLYTILAEREGRAVHAVPRTSEYDLDLPALERALDAPGVGAVILATPNDPTGSTITPTDIVRLLRHDPLVIVDETYFEFAGQSSARLVAEFDNLVILRDCGPWAGLGGLPIGYTLSSRPLATALRRAGLLAPPNRAAQLALLASLGDRAALIARVRQMRHERGRLFRQIRKLNLLDPLPSDAPFLLCAVRRSTAGRIAAALAERGILVRPIATPALPNHLRISVGRPEDTDAVYHALLKLAEQAVI
jgi:histidinol-phosphate aminotransferase